jgi:LTXXQ motif family protein
MTDQDRATKEAGAPGAQAGGRRLKASYLVLLLVAAGLGGLAIAAGLGAAEGFNAGGYRHGWHHGGERGGPMLGRLCSDRREDWLDGRIDLVESFVEFTPEQQPAWAALTVALRAGSERVGAACAELSGTEPGGAGARLARLETMLQAGLDVVHTVRPAFDDFYARLDDDQRAAVDRLLERHHRG